MNYNKLWKLLIDKHMKKKDLREAAGITTNTIAKMGKSGDDVYTHALRLDQIRRNGTFQGVDAVLNIFPVNNLRV